MSKKYDGNRIDKGQGVKKHNPDGSTNKEWKVIHYGTPMPKGAQENHGILPTKKDLR